MPDDRELKHLAKIVRKRIKTDPNAPYRVRRKKGDVSSRGQQDWEYRTVESMRTQPLGNSELDRMPEGQRHMTWRFAEVIPPDSLDFGDQVEFKSHWYEVKKLNDWDQLMSANMVFVE